MCQITMPIAVHKLCKSSNKFNRFECIKTLNIVQPWHQQTQWSKGQSSSRSETDPETVCNIRYTSSQQQLCSCKYDSSHNCGLLIESGDSTGRLASTVNIPFSLFWPHGTYEKMNPTGSSMPLHEMDEWCTQQVG